MKRVCFVNPTVLLKRPIAELINRLNAEEGYEIGLFCPKKLFKGLDKSLHYSDLAKKAKIYSYSTVTLPFLASEWPIPITPMFFINLFRVFLRYNIIHMWVFFYLSSFFVFFIKLFFPNKELILTCDTIPAYSFSMGRAMDTAFRIYYKLIGWFVFPVPNKVTLYGQSLVRYALKAGIRKDKIAVIPTGIDLNKFKDTKGDIRKRLGISKKTIVILYAGLLVPRKGIDIAIKTINNLKDLGIKLILVGDGPNRRDYEKQVERFGLQNKVIFTGWRRDVESFYKSADIFFLPSRGEGLAGVIMEAMSCGLPVVSSGIPCTTDLVKDGKTGFLCDIEDVGCYAEKLGRLIKDKILREQFGKVGLRKIKEFKWGNVIERYKELYGE